MRKRVYTLCLLMLLMLCNVTVLAGGKGLLGMLQEAQDNVENGDNNSSDDTDLTDIMGNWSKMNNPDEEMMEEGSEVIHSTLGYALSTLIMLFFALLALTTAVDLLWIGVPILRPLLYDSDAGSASAHLSSSVMYGIAQNEMARAQNAYMQGNLAQANMLQNQAMRSEAEGQYRDANWFGNRESLARAQQNAQGANKKRCFISSELRSIANQGQVNITVTSNTNGGVVGQGTTKKNLLIEYAKKRSVALVLFTACTILLTSSVFTDFGINVGEFILHWLGF